MKWRSITNFYIKFSVFKLPIIQLLKNLFFLLINVFILLQLRESFKDLKKKFNNLKFNYMKKAEKARNMKVLKIQIQQVDTYAEKLQVIEILGLVKASPVELLGYAKHHRRLAHHKIYRALLSYFSPPCHWLRHFSLFYSCYSTTYFSEVMLTQLLLHSFNPPSFFCLIFYSSCLYCVT